MPHIAGHLPVPYGMATGLGSLGPDKLGQQAGLSAVAAQQAYDPGGAYGRPPMGPLPDPAPQGQFALPQVDIGAAGIGGGIGGYIKDRKSVV